MKISKAEIIFHNGQPDGIRLVKTKTSPVTAYVIPRPLFSESKTVTGIHNPGVYYLIRETVESNIAELYIGQTTKGIDRIDDHKRKKDFWNKAILFLAEKDIFTLDIINGIEKLAIEKAKESKRYTVNNSVVPKHEIDEYDIDTIEGFYAYIQFIMATLGYKMDNAKEDMDEAKILHTTRNGIIARGLYDGEKFEVLEESEIAKNSVKSVPQTIEKQRQTAVKNGNVTEKDGRLYLTVSMSFSSPSTAASFVLGSSVNGWTEWKNKDGKTLDEVFRK